MSFKIKTLSITKEDSIELVLSIPFYRINACRVPDLVTKSPSDENKVSIHLEYA